MIDAAIDSIEADGIEWVPNSKRRQPPEDEEEDVTPPAQLIELHAELMRRLDEIEALVAQLAAPLYGIGHNRPPEPIEPEPITSSELAALSTAVGALRAQQVVPTYDDKTAVVAAATLTQAGSGITAWLRRHGDSFAAEAAKEGGKAFGKWGATAVIGLLTVLAGKLLEVGPLVSHWLHAAGLNMPF